MTFSSYHWNQPSFDDPRLQEAYDALRKKPWPAAEHWIMRMLNSDDIVAKSVALDFFSYWSSLQRHGATPPSKELSEKAARVARSNLSDAEATSMERDANAVRASALGALVHLCDETDTPLLLRMLATSTDPDVLAACALALGACLGGEYDSAELTKAIEKVVRGPFGDDVKTLVLLSLDRFEKPSEESLLLSLTSDPPPVGPYAALILANRDVGRYYDTLRQAIRHWPEDAPYPARFVKQLISELKQN